MNEEWKILELEGHLYEVSNLGKIRSVDRISYTKDEKEKWYKGRELQIFQTERGYCYVNITSSKGTTTQYKIYRLVATCFVDGKKRGKTQVNHKDGNKENNKSENLEWASNKENSKHAQSNLLYCQGSKHPHSKFSEDEILKIREQYKSGASQAELRKKYHVSNATMFNIVHNISWKSVKEVAE